jgi:hypothetical protein
MADISFKERSSPVVLPVWPSVDGEAHSPGRDVVPVGDAPDRFVFGKAWLDTSGLTFSRNDIHEVCAFRKVGKVQHVFPLDSVPMLIGQHVAKHYREMLSRVPEALNYVSALTVGQEFPEPMRTGRVPAPPRHRLEQAFHETRLIAGRLGGQGRAPLVEFLSTSDHGIDRDALTRRLEGVPPAQVKAVLEEIGALYMVVQAHASIIHAAGFQEEWERVEEVVTDLKRSLATRLRWINDGLSYSLGFLKEIMGAPRERIVAQTDRAQSDLRASLGEGDLKILREGQFQIWRECRRVAVFYQPLARMWDVLEVEGTPRSHVDALVRSTICRLQYFK